MASHALPATSTTPPSVQWEKYFQRFGCLRCERTDLPHAGDGFCRGCRELIVIQLKHVRKAH